MPADYDGDATEYDTLKEIWEHDKTVWGERFDEWPPTDIHGNEYDRDWFDVEELDGDGWLRDDRGQFNPFGGALEPTEGRCNCILSNCSSRYPEKRYCFAKPRSEYDYCHVHKHRKKMKAKQVLQHGYNAKTRDHLYNKLPDWKRLMVHGVHEDLLGRSRYEFAPEYDKRTFDFSDSPISPPYETEDGNVAIEVVYATEQVQASLELFAAAVDELKQLSANAIIADDEMRAKEATHAEHTGDGFDTLDQFKEHYLNLAYSRLVRDKTELLKRGGVPVDGETTNEAGESPLLERLSKITGEEPDHQEMVVEGSEMQRQIDAAGVDLDLETVDSE